MLPRDGRKYTNGNVNPSIGVFILKNDIARRCGQDLFVLIVIVLWIPRVIHKYHSYMASQSRAKAIIGKLRRDKVLFVFICCLNIVPTMKYRCIINLSVPASPKYPILIMLGIKSI